MKRTLVTYASRAGPTAEIAHAIAEQLREDGLDVDCEEIRDVHGLDRYDAVVIGSAVYAGHWVHPARAFLSRHRRTLEARPLWAFSSGPVGTPRPGQTGHDSPNEPRRIVSDLRRLGVRDHIALSGKVVAEPRGFTARAVNRNTPEQYRDRRDWREIHAWAHTIAMSLAALTERESATEAPAQAPLRSGRRHPRRSRQHPIESPSRSDGQPSSCSPIAEQLDERSA